MNHYDIGLYGRTGYRPAILYLEQIISISILHVINFQCIVELLQPIPIDYLCTIKRIYHHYQGAEDCVVLYLRLSETTWYTSEHIHLRFIQRSKASMSDSRYPCIAVEIRSLSGHWMGGRLGGPRSKLQIYPCTAVFMEDFPGSKNPK